MLCRRHLGDRGHGKGTLGEVGGSSTSLTGSRGMHEVEQVLLFKSSVEYLGHRVDAEGLRATTEKMRTIDQAPQPKNVPISLVFSIITENFSPIWQLSFSL